MPLSVMVFYTRRPEFSPDKFKSYLEDIHLPMLKEIMGPHYPLTYTLRYVVRVRTGAGDRLGATTSTKKNAEPDAPVLLVGLPSELGWDCIGEMVFRDELHAQQGLATVNTPEAQRLKEDEDVFAMPNQLRAVLMSEAKVVGYNQLGDV